MNPLGIALESYSYFQPFCSVQFIITFGTKDEVGMGNLQIKSTKRPFKERNLGPLYCLSEPDIEISFKVILLALLGLNVNVCTDFVSFLQIPEKIVSVFL